MKRCLQIPLTALIAVLCSAVATQAQTSGVEQLFPHFATGGGWTTSFNVHNPGTTPTTVRLQLFRSDGTEFVTRAVDINAGATATLPVDPSAALVSGWARLSSGGLFTATALFRFTGPDGRLVWQAGLLPAFRTNQFKVFASVRKRLELSTGIALANPSSTTESNLTMNRFNAGGQLLETRTLRIRPLAHIASFLEQEPFFPGVDGFDGVIQFSSTEPVTAVAFRLEGSQLAATPVVIAGEANTLSSLVPPLQTMISEIRHAHVANQANAVAVQTALYRAELLYRSIVTARFRLSHILTSMNGALGTVAAAANLTPAQRATYIARAEAIGSGAYTFEANLMSIEALLSFLELQLSGSTSVTTTQQTALENFRNVLNTLLQDINKHRSLESDFLTDLEAAGIPVIRIRFLVPPPPDVSSMAQPEDGSPSPDPRP